MSPGAPERRDQLVVVVVLVGLEVVGGGPRTSISRCGISSCRISGVVLGG